MLLDLVESLRPACDDQSLFNENHVESTYFDKNVFLIGQSMVTSELSSFALLVD